jgi:hypothetical protein
VATVKSIYQACLQQAPGSAEGGNTILSTGMYKDMEAGDIKKHIENRKDVIKDYGKHDADDMAKAFKNCYDSEHYSSVLSAQSSPCALDGARNGIKRGRSGERKKDQDKDGQSDDALASALVLMAKSLSPPPRADPAPLAAAVKDADTSAHHAVATLATALNMTGEAAANIQRLTMENAEAALKRQRLATDRAAAFEAAEDVVPDPEPGLSE